MSETQLTSVKLEKLSVIELYKHYAALQNSLPFLTPQSEELVKAELETCANLRSERVDRIYYAMAAHEDAMERIKKETELITQAKRHHESQLRQLKGLLNWLRRSLPVDTNKITGRNYEFTLVKKRELTVEVSSNPDIWSSEDREQYCVEEEVTTTKQVVLRSMSGEVLSTRTEPTTKTKILPNLDAIRTAYETGQHLPSGVKVNQEYSIRSKRIYGEPRMELQASEYPGQFLPED